MKELLKKLISLNIAVSLKDDNLNLEASKGIITKELLEEIKIHKHELIAFLKSHERDTNVFLSIPQAPVQVNYPLSSSQQRLWLLSQFDGGNETYNIPAVYELEGLLDIAAIEAAFNFLIERHESLRTIFKEDDQGEVRQYILEFKDVNFKIEYEDLQQDNSPETVTGKIEEEQTKPFSLSEGLLIRVRILKLSEVKFILSFVMHHIISDEWSMEIIVKELFAFYRLHIKGEFPAFEPLRIQYKDFAVWQQDELKGKQLEKHKNYWAEQFIGDIPTLAFPSQKQRPPIKTYNGKTLEKVIDNDLAEKIKDFSQLHGSTLFMSLLSMVKVLLYRYTSQDDIIAGSAIAGREHPDLANQIGFYVNTVPLRSGFKKEDTFVDLLNKIIETTLGAYEHQIYPLDELVSNLSLKRDMSRDVLFDVIVGFQKAIDKEEAVGLDDIKLSSYSSVENLISKFDLHFNFSETPEGLYLYLTYNTDIYSHGFIFQTMHHFEELAKQMILNPTLPVSQLDYLNAAEKLQLLLQFNDTKADYPKDKTIVDLFEGQAEKNPDSIAVLFESNSFTYKEIHEKSDRLAHYFIRKHDIKPDDLIGLKLERSEWMIIAILGILKSGAAYVPIDPQYPDYRIEYILKDSNCKVLCDENELSNFVEDQKTACNEILKPIVKSHDLAYVIYTSGTTGEPKGVAMEHKALVNYLFGIQEKHKLDSDFLFLSNICFDASLKQIFLPLIHGKKIHVYDSFKLMSLPEYVALNELGIINATPSIINELIDLSHDISLLNSLKTIIIGGETSSAALLDKITKKMPQVSLINAYGPTETCANSITHTYLPSDPENIIGKPISNTQVYILDDCLQPVPIGVEGNLYISGNGLARGYLNRPQLTNEKFISNPFIDGERMYNTGDVAHWLPDGNIIFSGRSDNQVKIRGYRIETEEIETVIAKYSDNVKQVVVVPKQVNSEKNLVAYFLSDEEIDTSELRLFLQNKLPHYMIPSFFVALETIPLTFNGKIDKRALPEITDDTIVREEYVAPGNELENQLVEIWQDVLGIDKISIKDNFFEIGGNSIKIIRMVGLLNKNLGKKISLMTAFQYPNIESLSAYLASNKIVDIDNDNDDREINQSIDLMDQTLLILNSIESEK